MLKAVTVKENLQPHIFLEAANKIIFLQNPHQEV